MNANTAESLARIDSATRNVKWHILPIIQTEAMTRGYTVINSKSFLEFDEIIVSNFHYSNEVTNWVWFGSSNKNTLGKYSIGKWKIKSLKNN
jgi:hypothetical protein